MKTQKQIKTNSNNKTIIVSQSYENNNEEY